MNETLCYPHTYPNVHVSLSLSSLVSNLTWTNTSQALDYICIPPTFVYPWLGNAVDKLDLYHSPLGLPHPALFCTIPHTLILIQIHRYIFYNTTFHTNHCPSFPAEFFIFTPKSVNIIFIDNPDVKKKYNNDFLNCVERKWFSNELVELRKTTVTTLMESRDVEYSWNIRKLQAQYTKFY